MPAYDSQPASSWIRRFAPLIPHTGPVLDVACGSGRHLRYLLADGHRAVGVDIDIRGVADLVVDPAVEIVRADLEGAPWPFGSRRFAGIVVANYLHRPLLPVLIDALAPGGVLLYETFARGNERFGKPSSPAYLLRADELLEAVRFRLHVVAFEQGEVASPRAAVVQRIVAVADRTPGTGLDGDPEPWPLPAP